MKLENIIGEQSNSVLDNGSVRVQFEIGHEASVRTKKTPEGFTHDWEVFVRGADNTDIQCFVEKVVFHLHETFPKPRRVIKDPPYVVKESGYAGFVLPIDVYLKNKEEPKKISFLYDLTLQPSGPPISRVLREPRLFQNPSEDFRRKLIRGGGVGVDTPAEPHSEDHKPPAVTNQNKTKISESPVKKHKPEVTSNHSFAELFGTPIRRMPEPKKLPEFPKKIPEVDASKDKKKVSKHGTYRDEKEVTKDKEKHQEKERSKEREKIKEKTSKRPPSPAPPPQPIKSKDDYKKHEEREKKKEDCKRKDEKEKKEKIKDPKEPDKQEHKKEKKDPKDGEYAKKPVITKTHDVKSSSEKYIEGVEKEKERSEKEKHKHRHKKKDKEKSRDKEKHRKDKEKSDKESREREKEKDKSSKRKHDEGKDKEEKVRKKSRTPSPVQERVKKGPLNALLNELGSSDSASPLSEDDDPVPSFKSFSKPPAKSVPEIKIQSPGNANTKLKSTNLNAPIESRPTEKEEKPPIRIDEVVPVKSKKEKSSSKKSKKSEKDVEKKKWKEERRPPSPSSEKEDDDGAGPVAGEKEKVIKDEREKDRLEEEKPKPIKDKENKKRKREKSEEKQTKVKKGSVPENNVAGPQAGGTTDVQDGFEDIRRPDKFTKEYVALLKDLQHRIMTLEDNAELQRVVKVIAETGQYEITKKTFDFDLCALDFETIKRLQECFAPT